MRGSDPERGQPPAEVGPARCDEGIAGEIYNAEDRDHAEKAVKEFDRAYGAKWSKAVKKVTDETDELLAFGDPRMGPRPLLSAGHRA